MDAEHQVMHRCQIAMSKTTHMLAKSLHFLKPYALISLI